MERILCYNITTTQSDKTILDFLKSLGYSHGTIASLKRTPDGILNNDIWARTNDKLDTGDVLRIKIAERHTSDGIVPVNLPLNIQYEDEDLMVVNKPSNMPVHPSQGNYDNTLANALAYYYQQQDKTFVYRCINRLDRDTTGLLILAKHAYSASLLSAMVADKKIRREYLAIVSGDIPDSGIIDAPIGRVKGSAIERQVDEIYGDPARTHWVCRYKKNGYALVSLILETGRTHQIRVHLKHLGYPLLGDFLYNPDYTMMSRQALHSCKLTFIHPITLENLTFTADPPPDMEWMSP